MSQRANYFKLGMFVIIGSVLLVIFLLIFGVGAIFEKGVIVETYMDESVQGLDVGSPLKRRGVTIGSVSEITFVSREYPEAGDEHGNYILVRSKIPLKNLASQDIAKLKEDLEYFSSQGMRARLASQGITGLAYLEVDFFDPDRYPPLSFTWEPKYPYVPSAPSRLTQIADSIEKISVNLEQVDFAGVGDRVEDVLVRVEGALDAAKIDQISNDLREAMTSIKDLSSDVEAITQSEDFKQLPSKISTATDRAIDLIDETEVTVRDIREKGTTVAERVDTLSDDLADFLKKPEIDQGLGDLSASAEKIREATEDLPAAMERFERILAQLERQLNSQEDDIVLAIRNLREATENLRQLTDLARKSPSTLIFSEPPPRLESK